MCHESENSRTLPPSDTGRVASGRKMPYLLTASSRVACHSGNSAAKQRHHPIAGDPGGVEFFSIQ